MPYISPDNPPLFLLHGTAETTVDIRQSERYVANARQRGAPVRYNIAVEGASHAFHMEPLDGLGDSDLKPEVSGFFDEFLKADGE